jgi:hypothetical protein
MSAEAGAAVSTFRGRISPTSGVRGLIDAAWTDWPQARLAKILANVGIFLAWFLLVAITTHYHVYWRDEVRPLSLVGEARTLWSLPVVIHNEGHPALWYVLLWIAVHVIQAKIALQLLAFTVAALAVGLFLFLSPFPFWWRALFVLGNPFAYEYAVMPRNYGIVALVLFFFVVAYVRKASPLILGLLLFLLAQTHVLAAMLVPLLLALVLYERAGVERLHSRATAELLLCALLALGGVTAAFLTVYPTQQDLAVGAGLHPSWTSVLLALALPGEGLFKLTYLFPFLGSLLIYGSVFGLVARPQLIAAALLSLWGFTLFFETVDAADYRQAAIWWVFLVSLYWIALSSREPGLTNRPNAFGVAITLFMPAILLLNIGASTVRILEDVAFEPASQSEAIGSLLNSNSELRRAILIPVQEQSAEAIPYYANNPIYLLREGKFGKTATLSSRAKADLTLGFVVAKARALRSETGRPVIFLCEYPLEPADAGQIFSRPDDWRFRYTAVELAGFREAFRQLPLGRHARNEDLDVYVLR